MSAPKVFVVGGTGAQGILVIKGLVQDGAYSVRALTRDLKSPRAISLLALGNVELVEGTFASEEDLRKGFRGCQYAFVNIDGFNSGEKTEMFWSIRAYELAIEEGIKFYVFGNLDYAYKKSGYNPIFRTGHVDGKGRIGEWILQQNKDNRERMGAALFSTAPYMEMALGKSTPTSPLVEDGTIVWRLPLGDGAVPFIALDDCAYYVRWLFDHQDETNGFDLKVATDHMNYHDIAAAFTKVTGKPAKYIDTDFETYWKIGGLAQGAGMPAGYNADPNDPATLTIRENFTGWWNLWRFSDSGGKKGPYPRDYDLLDRIHQNRIRTAEEWFRKEDEKGRRQGLGSLYERACNLKPVLKIAEDGRQGRI